MSKKGRKLKKLEERVKNRASRKVKYDKIIEEGTLGKKNMINYKSFLEELHKYNISLGGLPDFSDIQKGNNPTRKQYQEIRILYRRNFGQD